MSSFNDPAGLISALASKLEGCSFNDPAGPISALASKLEGCSFNDPAGLIYVHLLGSW